MLCTYNDSNTSEMHWAVLLNYVFSRRLHNKCSPEWLWYICCCLCSWVHKAWTLWVLWKVISTLQIAGHCCVGKSDARLWNTIHFILHFNLFLSYINSRHVRVDGEDQKRKKKHMWRLQVAINWAVCSLGKLRDKTYRWDGNPSNWELHLFFKTEFCKVPSLQWANHLNSFPCGNTCMLKITW